MKDFNTIFMGVAIDMASQSHCVHKHVGAVITMDTRIVSTGYNGPPSGSSNCNVDWPKVGCPKDANNGCSMAIHAEHNAISHAAKLGTSLKGSVMYTTLSPCIHCAKIIHMAGIKKVYYKDSYAEYKGLPSDEGLELLKTFGVEVEKYGI